LGLYLKLEKVIAVIPARSGSKRIPGKNYKKFCGRPIISYPLAALSQSESVSRIVVSTDSPDIRDIVAKNSASELFARSAEFSSDDATTMDAIKEFIRARKLEGAVKVLCVYPCTPMITSEIIEELIETYNPNVANFAILGFRVDSRLARLLKMEEDGTASILYRNKSKINSQNLPPLFQDAGQMYLGTVDDWLNCSDVLTSRIQILEIDSNEFVDIDSADDWELAEKFFLKKGLDYDVKK